MGAAASFLVNEYLEKGVTEVPARLHVAVDDSQLYVNNTKLVRRGTRGRRPRAAVVTVVRARH